MGCHFNGKRFANELIASMFELSTMEFMQKTYVHAITPIKILNMFTTTQQVSYSNWNPGEPNDSGGEDCVHLLESTHTWNDLNCARNHSYICQKGYINIFVYL